MWIEASRTPCLLLIDTQYLRLVGRVTPLTPFTILNKHTLSCYFLCLFTFQHHTHSFSLSLSFSHSISLSLSLYFSITPTHSFLFTKSLFICHTFSPTLIETHTLTHTHILSHWNTLTHTLYPIGTHAPSFISRHTLSYILTNSDTLWLTNSFYRSFLFAKSLFICHTFHPLSYLYTSLSLFSFFPSLFFLKSLAPSFYQTYTITCRQTIKLIFFKTFSCNSQFT